MGASLLASLLILTGTFLLGSLVLLAVLGRANGLTLASHGFPVGGGVLSYLVFLASWAGIRITSISLGGMFLLACLGAMAIYMITSSRSSTSSKVVNEQGRGRWAVGARLLAWVTLGVLGFLAASLAVGRSYSVYDPAAGWAVKGYGIMLEGTVQASVDYGMWGKAYPLNLPLQIGAHYLLGGDVVPGSMMLYPLFMVSSLLGLIYFWERHKVNAWLAVAGALVLATNPLIFQHGTVGFANLPMAFFLVQGTLWAISGLEAENPRELAFAGVLYALAAWTRPEGIGYSAAILTVIYLVYAGLRRPFRLRLLSIAPAIVLTVAIPWLVFARTGIDSSKFGLTAERMLAQLRDGQFHLHQARLTVTVFLGRALKPENWGFYLPTTLLLMAVGVRRFVSCPQPKGYYLMGASAVMAFMPVLLFWVWSYKEGLQFVELLIRSFDRAFIPAALMIFYTAVYLAGAGDATSIEGEGMDARRVEAASAE